MKPKNTTAKSTEPLHLHLVRHGEQIPTTGSPETDHLGWDLLLASMEADKNNQPATKSDTTANITSRAA